MEVRERVFALAEPLAASCGFVLVEVEFSGSVLRCVIHKSGGVTLDDTEEFHRALRSLLDAELAAPDRYVLEVSSPGAERRLRTERDFRIFAGRAVELASREAVQGRRQWLGRLVGVQQGAVVVATDAAPDGAVRVPLEMLAWARLRLE